MASYKLWFKGARGPFLIASAVPVIFAAALAYYFEGVFRTDIFLCCFFGIVLMHAAANMTNEYYDFKNKTDVVNRNRTIFSGGSGLLVEGKMTPAQYARGFTVLYIISLLCGLYIALKLGPLGGLIIFSLAAFSMLITYFYSCPPVHFAHRGLGELVVGLTFGPLPVFGTYFALTGKLSALPLIASVPIMMLIIAVLYINEFPDVEADSYAGKRNIVTRLGRRKARSGYYLLMLLTYIGIVVSIATGAMPYLSLSALITVPLALKASMILKGKYSDPKGVFPAMGMTILNHHLTGLILTGSVIIEAFTKR